MVSTASIKPKSKLGSFHIYRETPPPTPLFVSFFFISLLFSTLSLRSLLQAPSLAPLPLLNLLHSLLSLSHSLLALSASAASPLYPSHLCALLLLALACLSLSHLATNHPLLASVEYLTSEFLPG
jgi:hypothetical protein